MPCSLKIYHQECHQFFIVQFAKHHSRPLFLSFRGNLRSPLLPSLESSGSLVPADDIIPRPTRRRGSPSQAYGSCCSDEETRRLRGAGNHGTRCCSYTAWNDGFLLVYGTGCCGYTAWNNGFLCVPSSSRCCDAFMLLHRLVRICVLGCRRGVEGLLYGVPGVPEAVVVVSGCGRR